jgi:hypothetical protein
MPRDGGTSLEVDGEDSQERVTACGIRARGEVASPMNLMGLTNSLDADQLVTASINRA